MKHKGLVASMVLLGVALALSVWGDATLLSISNGSVTVTSSAPTTLDFPIARSGDTSYDAFLQFQTSNGAAIAGTDYTAASGSVVIPAGATSATIPVTVAGSNSNQSDKTFQMLLIGGGGAGMGFTPSFAIQQSFATGSEPLSVTTADINGDGKADLIVANSNDNTVSVLLNASAPGAVTPSFAAQQTFATGDFPFSVATADVNGDGKPDLIVTNYGSDTVSVLLNTTAPGASTASFATQQSFATDSGPESVTVADVNGDGKPDLIVADSFANDFTGTISVLLNTTAPGATTASFGTQQTFDVGIRAYSVTTADINGDGKPDLIVASGGDQFVGAPGSVGVLLNTTAPGATTPSFAPVQSFASGNAPVSVAVADINGDGRADLILANDGGNSSTSAPNSNTVSVLLNMTAPGATIPSFANQQTFATGIGPESVTASDLNGDGKPDLIVANGNDDTVSVLLNTTAPGAAIPSFAAKRTFATGKGPTSVTTADVNGDGKADLIVANYGDNAVSVLLNIAPAPTTTFDGSSFAPQQTFGTGASSSPSSVTSADINGDGLADLIVADEVNAVSVLLNTTAPGAATASFAAEQTFAVGNQPRSVTVADVNGDGRPDLIVANFGDDTVSVLLNTTAPGAPTASFAAPVDFGAGGGQPISVAAADVNGDGRPDLIVANGFTVNTVSVLLNTTAPGDTTPSFATEQSFATGHQPLSVTVADINGDGMPDLIVGDAGNVVEGNPVSVLLNTTAPGAITPSFAAAQNFDAGSEPFGLTTADVNGDGRPDLILANDISSGTVSVLLNTTAPGSTTASFAARQSFATGSGPISVTTADVNGDGKPDLIVANGGGNSMSVLLNTTAPNATTPSFDAQQTFAAGSAPSSVTATDINGYGKPDVIVANTNDNTVSVFLNSLYATVASGSPATGTIHFDIGAPTPTPTATPTATATFRATATVTATATATSTTTATPTATPTGLPHITVSPRILTLKTTNEAPVQGEVVIANTGAGPLTVNVKGPAHQPRFSMEENVFTVEPGASSTVTVTFAPLTKGMRDDSLRIKSNDPAHRRIVVDLIGVSK